VPLLEQGRVRPNDLKRSLPASTLLQFCEAQQAQIRFPHGNRNLSTNTSSPSLQMLLKKTDVVKAGLVWLEQAAPDYWKNH